MGVVKVSKKCSKEDVNAAIKAAADGPTKGIINFETQPLVSSDFMQTDYSNSVDAALDGDGRGPGQGRHVVRQRVGLLPEGCGSDPDRGREDAGGSLSCDGRAPVFLEG